MDKQTTTQPDQETVDATFTKDEQAPALPIEEPVTTALDDLPEASAISPDATSQPGNGRYVTQPNAASQPGNGHYVVQPDAALAGSTADSDNTLEQIRKYAPWVMLALF